MANPAQVLAEIKAKDGKTYVFEKKERLTFVRLMGFDPKTFKTTLGPQKRIEYSIREKGKRGKVGSVLLDPKMKDLCELNIKRKTRKIGLGRALLSVLERDAQRMGIKRLCLQTRKSTIDFYRKSGFDVIGEKEKVALMSKKVQSPKMPSINAVKKRRSRFRR